MTINDVLNMTFPSNFGSGEDDIETDCICEVEYNLSTKYKVSTAYGASKFVIFLNENEVAKIPFTGSYSYGWNEETEETDYDEIVFDEFCTKDYCAVEAAVYSDAVAAGVEQFFASTKFAGNTFIDKTPIYLSERVIPFDCLDNEQRSCSDDSRDKARKLHGRCPIEWTGLAIEYYGETAVKKLFDFIEKEGIDDLHRGNVGIRKDGSPCLLDYSGFEC
jgi:hypothetical protein